MILSLKRFALFQKEVYLYLRAGFIIYIEIYEKYCRQQELSQIACIKKELTNRSTLIKFSLTFWVHYTPYAISYD